MTVGHDKTKAKLLVPSHRADSGADCTVRVAGKSVRPPDQLKLLSIALDKLIISASIAAASELAQDGHSASA